MSDLVVDYGLLRTSAKQLKAIQVEFRDLDEWKGDITSVVGAGELKEAMADFIDNWDDNRKRLLKSLETVGKMVEGTRDAFAGLDHDLAAIGRKDGK
ncbi:WXG100 family type VII secretion target [Streptomyces sp. NPDC091281]|uniref:WXG100 family type VII secretion target n=1 Tax=Streptomyces sp. NPDC091281 TaxID=3365985 RepID=UPI0037F3897D